MQLIAIATRIEVRAPDENERLHQVEYPLQVVVLHGGQDDGNSSGRLNGVVIAGGNEAERGTLLARRTIVSVQSNERLPRHRKSLCERGATEIHCGDKPGNSRRSSARRL